MVEPRVTVTVDMDDSGTIALKILNETSDVGRMTRRNAEAVADRARANAPVASGRLRASIKVVQARSAGGQFASGWDVIADTPYSRYVNDGRAPGRMPPVDNIRRWTLLKGIDPRAAFPIARAIGRRGTKPTDFMSDAMGAVRWAL